LSEDKFLGSRTLSKWIWLYTYYAKPLIYLRDGEQEATWLCDYKTGQFQRDDFLVVELYRSGGSDIWRVKTKKDFIYEVELQRCQIENPPASLVTIYKEIRTIKEAVYRERRGYTDAERQRLDDLIPHSFSRFNSLVGDTFVESLLELDLH
jgi:hypothetical protein